MATIAAKATRRAQVNARLADQSDQLAERFGLEVPAPVGPVRDPELEQIMTLERVAAIFDGLLGTESMMVETEATEALLDLKLDELKERVIAAGVDAASVNKERSKKGVIALLTAGANSETGEE